MRPAVIATLLLLLLMVEISSCMATYNNRRALVMTNLHEDHQLLPQNDGVLSDDNNDHHQIPRKEYDNKPGSGQHTITDENDNGHHMIPRKDYPPHTIANEGGGN
ncbi:hypothetical protein HN51_009916 [Arachis hypogaea]|uniref:Uncharacterized protein n=1 Tax=Arachis hypogaea TaxID=3818 RepID=A0A445E4S0_ARAHY|nr:uncharacterized protein DS421_3g60750 [Arachis hypogaea]RYR70417.1 hypothetical protein Ahy_A03g016912 [Arachis hypogaea]